MTSAALCPLRTGQRSCPGYLLNSKEWSDRDIEKALSSEALTAAVMQRYHIIGSTRDALRRTLRGLSSTRKPATTPLMAMQTKPRKAVVDALTLAPILA